MTVADTAEAHHPDAAFKMRQARVRYRSEVAAKTALVPFRMWARRTYRAWACDGKLVAIVGGSP